MSIILWHFELLRQTLIDCRLLFVLPGFYWVNSLFVFFTFGNQCLKKKKETKRLPLPFTKIVPVFSLLIHLHSLLSGLVFLHLLLFPLFFLTHVHTHTSGQAVVPLIANISSVKHVFHFRCGTPGTEHCAVATDIGCCIPAASWIYSVFSHFIVQLLTLFNKTHT